MKVQNRSFCQSVKEILLWHYKTRCIYCWSPLHDNIVQCFAMLDFRKLTFSSQMWLKNPCCLWIKGILSKYYAVFVWNKGNEPLIELWCDFTFKKVFDKPRFCGKNSKTIPDKRDSQLINVNPNMEWFGNQRNKSCFNNVAWCKQKLMKMKSNLRIYAFVIFKMNF